MAAAQPESVHAAATSRWGAGVVRSGTPGDLVGGVAARVVIEPVDEPMLAEVLAWAHRDRLAVVLRGSGTRLHRSRPPARLDAIVGLRRLSVPVDHRPGDLTASLPAGATLDTVNAVLGRERQWLPLDPPAAGSSIGGLIATNDSGPRRLQHGTPRDLILGVRMVLADGRRAAAGGQVVKNVTGYDLPRLLCGSEGRLAAIASATFKLAPMPAASRTVVAAAARVADLDPMIASVSTPALAPVAVELEAPTARLLLRFEASARAAAAQAGAAAAALAALGAVTDVCEGGAEEAVWREHDDSVWRQAGAVVKIALLPTQVVPFVDRLRVLASSQRADYAVAGRATLGVLTVRWHAAAEPARGIEALRQDAHAVGGTATLMAFPVPLSIRTDLWDDAGATVPLAQAVKARLDPAGTLAPGRGPGGSDP